MLATFGALDQEYKPTPLGLLVGDVRSENELWAAMVLLSDGLADLDGTRHHHTTQTGRQARQSLLDGPDVAGTAAGCSVCMCLGVDLVGVLSALVNDVTKPDVRMSFTASQPAQVTTSPAPPHITTKTGRVAGTDRQAGE